MQLIMLTHNTVKGYFDATTTDGLLNDFDRDTAHLIQNVIAHMGGMIGTEEVNGASPYLLFIYMVLNLHSTAYVKASRNDSGINYLHLELILTKLRNIAPGLTADDVLIADKMDILYGTQHLTHCEHNKFSVWFYEHIYEIASNTITPERVDEIYEQAIRVIEIVVSQIEQNIIFIGQDADIEDTVVLCVYPFNGALFFIID